MSETRPTVEGQLAAVRALAESEGMIQRCPEHGIGPNAVITSPCDWCAAFGVDQDWREVLLATLGLPATQPDPADLITLARCDWCAEQVPADELTDGRECGQAHCATCSFTEGCLPCQRDMQADVR